MQRAVRATPALAGPPPGILPGVAQVAEQGARQQSPYTLVVGSTPIPWPVQRRTMMLKRYERDNPDSCWNKAGDDEIVFVLLERDPSMFRTLRFWVKDRCDNGLNKYGDPKILDALDTIVTLEEKARVRHQEGQEGTVG